MTVLANFVGISALLLCGCAAFAPISRAGESNVVENVRLSLRKEGFKIDLSEFDFAVPKEVQARSAAVCTDGKVNPQRPVSFLEDYDLLTPVGDHAAVVVWNQEALAYPSGFMDRSYQYDPGTGTNVWPALREMMDDAAVQLNCAATGALSGPIGFNLDATGGSYMLLPHLSGLTYCTKMLGGRAMLALHDHDLDAAWTDLLAATRIVTAWQTEPAEVSEVRSVQLSSYGLQPDLAGAPSRELGRQPPRQAAARMGNTRSLKDRS